MIARIESVTRTASRFIAYISCFLILFAACVTLLEVFLRSVVHRPFYGANDVVLTALTIAVIGFFPLMIESGHHMRIDVVGKRIGGKGRVIIEAFANSVTFLVLVGFAWQFWIRGDRLAGYGERTQMLQIPVAPIWWVAAGIMGVAVFAQLLITLTGRTEHLSEETEIEEFEGRS